eukprot:TRINITY_DN2953_c1_g2_i1.p1 TRINITY_DN2953_c1_g2~~TRINITY_DN2953_c1_g2_i1.p1  ORF type:complete len:493 (-),score=119.60 TRINITY_DN2953_c1_g2_i1:277-1755(-)
MNSTEETINPYPDQVLELLGQSYKLDEEHFISLLTRLIGETEHLQNKPPQFIPEEDRAGRHALASLLPHSKEQGGPLEVQHIHFDEEKKRGNIIVKYPRSLEPKHPKSPDSVSFIGSHMDVVLADPQNWDPKHPPFQLTREGDLFYGRGTTDCLGHVALITDLFVQLAKKKPQLAIDVFAVFISDEEEGSAQVGIERLCPPPPPPSTSSTTPSPVPTSTPEKNYLEPLKNGCVFWVDVADKTPTVGTGGCCQWELIATGKMFHSGFPHKSINAIELLSDAILSIQADFYSTFPFHPLQTTYNFDCSSSFKPTIISSPDGSVNQIPGLCTAKGDLRLLPFYSIHDAMKCIETSVARLNNERFASLTAKKQHGPDAGYEIEGFEKGASLKLRWLMPPIQGVACDLDSMGLRALKQAIVEVCGKVEQMSLTGSLPLIADLKEAGFDVQTIGFGVEDVYHADNEYLRLQDFKEGFKILLRVIDIINRVQVNEKKTK